MPFARLAPRAPTSPYRAHPSTPSRRRKKELVLGEQLRMAHAATTELETLREEVDTLRCPAAVDIGLSLYPPHPSPGTN